MEEGIYLVNKPKGWTSFDVVAYVRSRSGIRKIGHAGTLDPFAEGLLILFLGKTYTKLQDQYLKSDKEYLAELVLGQTSTTLDSEGEIREVPVAKEPTEKEVLMALKKLTGKITQTPPKFSAVKSGGVKAYKLARAGKEPNLKKREIEIKELELLDYIFPVVRFRVLATSGTYVRVLGQDIARSLGTEGYLRELKRTKINKFSLEMINQVLVGEIEGIGVKTA